MQFNCITVNFERTQRSIYLIQNFIISIIIDFHEVNVNHNLVCHHRQPVLFFLLLIFIFREKRFTPTVFELQTSSFKGTDLPMSQKAYLNFNFLHVSMVAKYKFFRTFRVIYKYHTGSKINHWVSPIVQSNVTMLMMNMQCC